ncbi:hypothetical protein DFQ27_000869 [Actinomortierella ambigua]|uniref:Uncharacterized protein n=1 Tax=Actinomortierella ambigua TaxID=1343610 RepID=A0A9P6QDT5_9FUNG|nr:hypothetical protein DFQ27_000869 [Actinomortierella ambigua]
MHHHHDHAEDPHSNKLRAQQLIDLLASTGFPNATSIDPIVLEEHLLTATQGEATQHFLDWVLNNTSPATNWPAYERPDLLETLLLADNESGFSNDDQRSNADLDREYEALLTQHDQLQHTLDTLSEELQQLQLQESETADAARILSTQTSDLSVRMDTTLATLEETAFKAFQDPTASHDGLSTATATPPTASALYLHQCHEQIARIQTLDEQFLVEMERMINHRLESDPFRSVREAFQRHEGDPVDSSTSSNDLSLHQPGHQAAAGALNPAMETTVDTSTSIFHLLLASDQTMDQEMVELCKLYRSTKMNHLRTVAMLKGLEKQVQVLQEIDDQFTEAVAHQEHEKQQQQHPSNHHHSSSSTDTGPALGGGSLAGKPVQTIAGAKAAALQQMRQNEIALISAQREASRLLEELDQTLSTPLAPSTNAATTSASSLEGSRGRDGEAVRGDAGDIGSSMAELYDRIARGDIELRFLEARYHDYIRSQRVHLSELEKAIDALLDLYGCNQTIATMMAEEQTSIQQGKDTLGSLIMYLARIPAAPGTPPTLTSTTPATVIADQLQQRALDGLAEDRQLHQRRAELVQQTSDLARGLHAKVVGLSYVQEALDRRLLHRHSAVADQGAHASKSRFASKQLREAQQVLGSRTEELRELQDRASHIVNEQLKK